MCLKKKKKKKESPRGKLMGGDELQIFLQEKIMFLWVEGQRI